MTQNSQAHQMSSGNPLSELKARAIFAQAWHDSIGFSLIREEIEEGENKLLRTRLRPESQIREKNQEIQAGQFNQISGLGFTDEQGEIYQRGFLEGLNQVIEIGYKDKPPSDDPAKAPLLEETAANVLWREWNFSAGRTEAFRFAATCQGDLAGLQSEIEEREGWISEASSSGKGFLTPGSSPRMYQNGYLEGLREAVQIIKNVNTGEISATGENDK